MVKYFTCRREARPFIFKEIVLFFFKPVIEKGGGNFDGVLKVTHGSAMECNQEIYDGLPPLMVTGSLDTSSHSITVNIKGKTYL